MRVLLVKTSSMGDLIHTFPALTDAGNAIPGVTFDWVVEESFATIPTWHPLVGKVIPVALRRWRKGIFSRESREGWKQLRKELNTTNYDLILDAQGLVKSALVTVMAKGPRAGLDWGSAREALASLVYQRKYKVNFYQHAVVRMRSLFSLALDYALPTSAPDFGLNKLLICSSQETRSSLALRDVHRSSRGAAQAASRGESYLVFLFGTTWTSKQWPLDYWISLANVAGESGYRIKISGGSEAEMQTCQQMAKGSHYIDVLPRLSIPQMAELLAGATGAVAVDTGFGHLAAALNIPTVSLYGSTNPEYTGALGQSSVLLAADFPCSPCLNRTCTYKMPSVVTPACYGTLPPERVWQALELVIARLR